MSNSLPQDGEIVERLYKEHHKWLKTWIWKRIECPELAADILQDTFCKFMQQPTQVHPREPKAYLSTIAKSLIIDRARRNTHEKSYLACRAKLPFDSTISEEQKATTLETLKEIDQLLDGLTARQRHIFVLAQLEGLSFVDISKRLDLSVNTVRKHYLRVLEYCSSLGV